MLFADWMNWVRLGPPLHWQDHLWVGWCSLVWATLTSLEREGPDPMRPPHTAVLAAVAAPGRLRSIWQGEVAAKRYLLNSGAWPPADRTRPLGGLTIGRQKSIRGKGNGAQGGNRTHDLRLTKALLRKNAISNTNPTEHGG